MRIKQGRKPVVQYEQVPIGEKTILNEMMRLSAVFVFARTELDRKRYGLPTWQLLAVPLIFARGFGSLGGMKWLMPGLMPWMMPGMEAVPINAWR